MVASRHALFALAAAFIFASQVQAASSLTLSLSSCATACIQTESCETSDVKCVCKGARSKLLYNVAVCMYYRCPDEISSFSQSFIAPLESACEAINRDIPQSKINLAEATAKLLADKVPKTSSKEVTTPTTSARASPTPKTSTTTSPVKQTTTTTPKAQPTTATETEESTTSSEDDEPTTTNSPTTTSPSEDTPTTTPTTLATATNSPSRAATQSTTSTRAAGRPDPTDSSPFATTPNAAGRSRSTVSSWLLASLPIALAVAMR
ncbi:hypothetical protein GE09DRAFT_419532 [Coniochaeta sp. 2T2.1]|nr:hypothetical protein GE09DRAFT_419532 [Coniochaeta sp. 2T2.1]